ncbi:MAG: TfuA-like protein [Inquilinaceae bacterium]
MTAIVFLGPTLPVAEAPRIPGVDYRPPVRQGDVYGAVRAGPLDAIAIVDGYFQDVPSVWHKEILWALDRGVPVLGAASMGALRAAELDVYGMEGVGRIHRAFKDGIFPPFTDEAFEDDDEVAVIHGPAELGYPALSDAMVDIRATLDAATRDGLIPPNLRDRAIRAFKTRFYPDRRLDDLPALLAELADDPGLTAPVAAWLATNRVSVKKQDALSLLQRLEDILANPADASAPSRPVRFERTTLWAAFVEAVEAGPAPPDQAVLDELRLDPVRWGRLWPLAAARALALADAGPMPDVDRRGAVDGLRRRLGLWSRDALVAWCAANDLDSAAFARLAVEEAAIRAAGVERADATDRALVALLRLEGEYAALADRAGRKTSILAAAPNNPSQDAGGAEVLEWYFEHHLGGAVPADVDAFARAHGFAGEAAFLDAVRRERRVALAAAAERAGHD